MPLLPGRFRARTDPVGCCAPITLQPLPSTRPTAWQAHPKALGTVPQGWQQLCLDVAALCHLSGAVRSPRPPGCWVTGQKKPLEGPWLFLQISCHPPSGSSDPTVREGGWG